MDLASLRTQLVEFFVNILTNVKSWYEGSKSPEEHDAETRAHDSEGEDAYETRDEEAQVCPGNDREFLQHMLREFVKQEDNDWNLRNGALAIRGLVCCALLALCLLALDSIDDEEREVLWNLRRNSFRFVCTGFAWVLLVPYAIETADLTRIILNRAWQPSLIENSSDNGTSSHLYETFKREKKWRKWIATIFIDTFAKRFDALLCPLLGGFVDVLWDSDGNNNESEVKPPPLFDADTSELAIGILNSESIMTRIFHTFFIIVRVPFEAMESLLCFLYFLYKFSSCNFKCCSWSRLGACALRCCRTRDREALRDDVRIETALWWRQFVVVWFFATPDVALTASLFPLAAYLMAAANSPSEMFVNIVAVLFFAELDNVLVKMLLYPRKTVGEIVEVYVDRRNDKKNNPVFKTGFFTHYIDGHWCHCAEIMDCRWCAFQNRSNASISTSN